MTYADDELETLLRTRRIAQVPDEGFTERVLAALPPRRTRRRWVVALFAALGTLLALPTLVDPRVLTALAELVSPLNTLALWGAAALLAWSACAWALYTDRNLQL